MMSTQPYRLALRQIRALKLAVKVGNDRTAQLQSIIDRDSATMNRLSRERDAFIAAEQSARTEAVRWQAACKSAENAKADAEYRAERLERDRATAIGDLGEKQVRIVNLLNKLHERENAIVALGIRMGEAKLNESFSGSVGR